MRIYSAFVVLYNSLFAWVLDETISASGVLLSFRMLHSCGALLIMQNTCHGGIFVLRYFCHSFLTSFSGTTPWQIIFAYRQVEATVDNMTYDELYEVFGGNCPPPAVSREQV